MSRTNSGIGRVSAHVDAAVARIAARQYGNVTRAQLRAAGLNDDAIAHRVARGRLHRVHRGVYAVGAPPSMPLQRAAAAVLACGAGGALSHGAALALFLPGWPEPLELISPCCRRLPGLLVHRSTTLAPRDLTTQLGIRVTHPARTMPDVAPGHPTHRLSRLVNEALHTPFLTRGQLAEACATHPHHRGRGLILPFADAGADVRPTRSGWEDGFPAWCARHDLPAPLMAYTIGSREVDVLFPDAGLIVELDSWEFHRGRESFEEDRDRDAEHLALGLATVRITWDRQHGAPDMEAERLRRILALRRGWHTRTP